MNVRLGVLYLRLCQCFTREISARLMIVCEFDFMDLMIVLRPYDCSCNCVNILRMFL